VVIRSLSGRWPTTSVASVQGNPLSRYLWALTKPERTPPQAAAPRRESALAFAADMLSVPVMWPIKDQQ
jgi:hypothetical protein